MEEHKSAAFYSSSFYEKINDFEKCSDKSKEIKKESINNEKNYIIINNCPQDKMNTLIYSIENEIKNWKSSMMRQFEMMTEEFNIIKNLIQNSQKQKVESLTEKNSNEINLLKNNSSLSEEEKNNLSKLNKTSCNGINNNSFNKNNLINNSILENKDKIKEICQKMKELNLIQISSKYDNTIKQNISGIESLLNSEESDEKSIETKLDTSSDIEKNIIVPKAFSYFGLDNQFEIIKNKENNLLIHIDNFNDLILKLINKQNQITQTYIIKKVFENEIREIKYFSFEKDMNYDFLLVSSRKNELKVYKLLLDCELFQDILKEINHIKDIYKKEGSLNENFFDLSSCVIRFNNENDMFEILTTCWEGHSIKIYNLKSNDCIKEIVSKTSCNIKYCNLVDNDYFVFCGCNSQDKYTCANCIDLKNLKYSIERDENVEFIKYSDNSSENTENVFFNFLVYDSPYDLVKYLILCDEKGYIRFFNFDFKKKNLIKKIFPSFFNKSVNYKNPKMYRLNSILLYKENYLLITERNTGYVYKVSLTFDNDDKKCCVKTMFSLFDKEIISLRKYENDDFIFALGKNFKTKFEEEEKILCFKFG